jgi:hypothetical protein
VKDIKLALKVIRIYEPLQAATPFRRTKKKQKQRFEDKLLAK